MGEMIEVYNFQTTKSNSNKAIYYSNGDFFVTVICNIFHVYLLRMDVGRETNKKNVRRYDVPINSNAQIRIEHINVAFVIVLNLQFNNIPGI